MLPRSAVVRIDHVQLAYPPGGEPLAREFYGGTLGFTEIEKPELRPSDELPGTVRGHTKDPFGNRIELIADCAQREDPAFIRR